MQINIVITGVGGQGTLLASRILGALAADNSMDVKVSEVHGMAQRGGNVVTYVRIGDRVHSPLVEYGQADVVLAFEQLEALRALPYLKEGGTMIVNDETIVPVSVAIGTFKMPDDVEARLDALGAKKISAGAIARAAGSPKSTNVVLVGALSTTLPFDEEAWESAIRRRVPPKTIEANIEAFRQGRAAVKG